MITRRVTLASLAACASLALAASAQAGTKIVNSWADSQFGKMKFKNVLAIVATKDASLRRTAEDEICRNIVKVACTRGYTILPESEAGDKPKAIAKIKEGGFDAVILLRAIGGDGGVTREAGAAMPQYYWTFDVYYGYWGGSWGVPYVAANTKHMIGTSTIATSSIVSTIGVSRNAARPTAAVILVAPRRSRSAPTPHAHRTPESHVMRWARLGDPNPYAIPMSDCQANV